MNQKNIKADFAHLQKLFILPNSEDKFLEFGNSMLNMLHNYFTEKGGIHSSISLSELEKLFSNIDIPTKPELLKDIFAEIQSKIISHSVKVSSPYYIGHMTTAVPYFTILLDMIISALNQNQVKIETAKASTYVERELISWIHRLIYNYPESFYKKNIQNHSIALGNVTVDGTLANLTGLLVARNKLFQADKNFGGIDNEGILEAYKYYKCSKAVIFISQRGHYSFDKIARILGIGASNIIKIPVDSSNKIDLNELKKECKKINDYNLIHDEKIKILAIVGIAGTTETGNIDNLIELRKIADNNNAHFHVDAAWGGPILFVERYKHMFKGIETADSVTFDCHKLFYASLSLGMVLFKNKDDLNHLKHTTSYILRPDSRDQGRFTVEGSRSFSCLKPWTILKIFGSEGFQMLFENAYHITAYFRNIIETHSNFELLNNPELFIINYRFIPMETKQMLDKYTYNSANDSRDKILKINSVINELNVQLHRELRDADNSFVSRTVLESTKYRPQTIAVLRAVTVNPLTTPGILNEIIDEQNKLGLELYNTNFNKLLKKL